MLPFVQSYDEQGNFPSEIFRRAWELGFVSLKGSDYDNFSGNKSEESISYLLQNGLDRWPFFMLLSIPAITEASKYDKAIFHNIFSEYFSWEYILQDQVIFTEGQSCDKFYLVISGAIEISRMCADGGFVKSSAYKRNVRSLHAGAWFGELIIKGLVSYVTVQLFPCI